jgi:serine phosphatase RsbU (regulator of sigma subunit)
LTEAAAPSKARRSFAWAVLLPAIAFFALLMGVVGALLTLKWTRDIEARAREGLAAAMGYVNQEIKSRERTALALASLMADNPDVSESLLKRDRLTLSILSQQRFYEATTRHGVKQLQFHIPPAISFLRMHEPTKFGDDISAYRKTVVRVNESLQPISGIEIGRDGIGLRGVSPVQAKGKHAGSVEFGLSLETDFLNEMKSRYKLDWQLLLKQEYAALTKVDGKADANSAWTALASTLPSPISILDAAMQGATTQGGSPFSAEVMQAGAKRPYLVYTYPLTDFSGALVGALQAVENLTPQLEERNRAIGIALATILGSLALGGLGLAWIVNRHTRPLSRVAGIAHRIADGDLSALQALNAVQHRNVETQELTQSVRSMTGQLIESIQGLEQRVAEKTADIGRLNAQLQAENRRMGAELDVQRRLQEMLLPSAKELSDVPGLDIAAHMTPAHEVSGDYYDVFANGDQTTIAIGDVTGHGLESGVVMLMTQSIVRGLLARDGAPAAATLEQVNRALRQNLARSGLDKTLSFCLLDYRSTGVGQGTLRLTGQHESAIVVRQTGAVESYDTDALGFPMGLIDDIGEFVAQLSLSLNAQDVVVLYTDGLTEAEDKDGNFYGATRASSLIAAHRTESAEAIKAALIADLNAFMSGTPLQDDVTLLVLKQK